MKRITLLFSVACLLLFTAHRVPAPIVEEATPTPRPKVKPQVEAPTKQHTAKAVATPKVSFAGTWTGTASGTMQQAVFGPTTLSSNYKIDISADERSASWTSSAWIFATFHASVQKHGRTLNWTCERHDLAGKTMITCALEMNSNGTASYSESSGLVNGLFKGAGYKISGILVRQSGR